MYVQDVTAKLRLISICISRQLLLCGEHYFTVQLSKLNI